MEAAGKDLMSLGIHEIGVGMKKVENENEEEGLYEILITEEFHREDLEEDLGFGIGFGHMEKETKSGVRKKDLWKAAIQKENRNVNLLDLGNL